MTNCPFCQHILIKRTESLFDGNEVTYYVYCPSHNINSSAFQGILIFFDNKDEISAFAIRFMLNEEVIQLNANKFKFIIFKPYISSHMKHEDLFEVNSLCFNIIDFNDILNSSVKFVNRWFNLKSFQ